MLIIVPESNHALTQTHQRAYRHEQRMHTEQRNVSDSGEEKRDYRYRRAHCYGVEGDRRL